MPIGLAITLGAALSLVHYYSEQLSGLFKRYRAKIISFSAGMSITYIFLQLLPEFHEGVIIVNKLLFLTVLLGFILFHLVEKYIYQAAPKIKILKELAIEDSVVAFIYHFIIGIIIVALTQASSRLAVLFFIPMAIHTAASTLPVDLTKSQKIRIIMASSTILGVIAASSYKLLLHAPVYYSLLGFVIGALLFVVMRHSLPQGKEGSPFYFAAGVVIYTIIILGSWMYFGTLL